MIARFIFAETVYDYEHSAPHFMTKDIKLPDGFVPLRSMGRGKYIQPDKDHPFGESVTVYDPMDLKGVELIDEGGAKCIDGLRGDPDCRGCEEHCEDVRKRNCINWSGDHCAKTKGIFCPVSCDEFRAYKPAEGGAG